MILSESEEKSDEVAGQEYYVDKIAKHARSDQHLEEIMKTSGQSIEHAELEEEE